MCKDLQKYLDVKAQIKALTKEAGELQKGLISSLKISEGSKIEKDGYKVSYMPAQRWVFKAGRGKGLAGLIKRKLGEEFLFQVMKFDRKDLAAMTNGSSKEVDKFFECKQSYAFRVSKGE